MNTSLNQELAKAIVRERLEQAEHQRLVRSIRILRATTRFVRR